MEVENLVLSWKTIAIYLVVAKNAFLAVFKIMQDFSMQFLTAADFSIV